MKQITGRPFGALEHQFRNAWTLALADAFFLLLSLWAGRLAVHLLFGDPLSVRYSILIIPVWWIGALLAGLLPGWGLGEVEELRRTELLITVVFAIGGVLYFFIPKWFSPSRIAYVLSFLSAVILLPLGRWVVVYLLARTGSWGCPAVVYGNPESAREVVRAFNQRRACGYRLVGVFLDSPEPLDSFEGLPVLGDYHDTAAGIPAAVVCMGSSAQMLATHFDRTLAEYRHVLLLPFMDVDFLQFVAPRTLGGLVGMEVTSNLLNPASHAVKRLMDLLVVLLTAPLWLPVTGLVFISLRMSGQPAAFYRKERMGRGGRPFVPLKFQTMLPDADRILEQALAADESLRREWNDGRKLRNDPRVTRLGRFLRRWSLDELPQLINVLKGEMSLVGPRPLPDYHREDLHPDTRRLREQVQPGLTGLWQVSGRSDAGTAGLDKWDRYYVRNWSIWLDVVILIRTIGSVLRGKGAY